MISVIVSTFGDQNWKQMGDETFETLLLQSQKPASSHRIHAESLAVARNTGAEQAEGEWLLFLDADDLLDSKYVEEMNRSIDRYGNRDVLIRPAITLTDDPVPRVLPEKLLSETNFMIIGTLVKRDTFLDVGGFRELPLLEDWDLWIRCWKQGSAFGESPKSIYHISISHNSRNNQDEDIQRKVYAKIRRDNNLH